MKQLFPWSAIVLAVVITTLMDFNGLTAFSAFPLILISILLAWTTRLNKTEMGLRFGSIRAYGSALLYPLVVLGLTTLIAFLLVGFQIDESRLNKEMVNLLAGIIIGPLMVLLTEEGFFRGTLWAAFRRTGLSETKTLFLTSSLFTIWHISAVTSGSSYALPLSQVPVYLINATLIGLIWGSMRLRSGNTIVPTISHAVWNAVNYFLFAFGQKTGILGVENTVLLGPEVGYLGILLNGAFLLWFWRKTISNSITKSSTKTH